MKPWYVLLWITSSYILYQFLNRIAHIYVQPINVGLFSNLLRNQCTGGSLSVNIIMNTSSNVEIHFGFQWPV